MATVGEGQRGHAVALGCTPRHVKMGHQGGSPCHAAVQIQAAYRGHTKRRPPLASRHWAVLGAPGSGTGAVVQYISQRYGVVCVSPPALVLAAQAKQATQRGEMDDSTMARLVGARLQEGDCRAQGWVLEGYPSRVGQVEALLHEGVALPSMHIVLQATPEELAAHARWRRVGPHGELYHLRHGPLPPPGVPLRRLAVDSEHAIARKRLSPASSPDPRSSPRLSFTSSPHTNPSPIPSPSPSPGRNSCHIPCPLP